MVFNCPVCEHRVLIPDKELPPDPCVICPMCAAATSLIADGPTVKIPVLENPQEGLNLNPWLVDSTLAIMESLMRTKA